MAPRSLSLSMSTDASGVRALNVELAKTRDLMVALRQSGVAPGLVSPGLVPGGAGRPSTVPAPPPLPGTVGAGGAGPWSTRGQAGAPPPPPPGHRSWRTYNAANAAMQQRAERAGARRWRDEIMERHRKQMRSLKSLNTGMKVAAGVGLGVGALGVGAAYGAFSVSMGASPLGFLLQSAQTYMQLSGTIAQLNRRFREGERDVASWGGRYAYTIARSAQIAQAIGAQINQPRQGDYNRIVGFARYTGMEPTAAAGTVGALQQLAGGQMSSRQLAVIMGRARIAGMDQGRLEEYMQFARSAGEMQFGATGRLAMSGSDNLGALLAMPGAMLGNQDPRAQGSHGMDFLGRLQSGVTGTQATQTYLLRMMGYGTKNGPGYIEARKRLERGITDPDNVISMFSGFQRMGLGRTAMFQALDAATGGKMKAHELESMVDHLKTPEQLAQYTRLAKGGNADAMAAFMGSLSKEERSTFNKEGFAGLGQGRAGVGEAAAVQMEALQMQVGKPITTAILGLREVIQNMIKGFGNLFDVDWEDVSKAITGATDTLVKMSRRFETWSEKTGSVVDLWHESRRQTAESIKESREHGGRDAALWAVMAGAMPWLDLAMPNSAPAGYVPVGAIPPAPVGGGR